MGQENCGTDQTHYSRHCLKHYQRPLRHCATESGGDHAQSKRFPGNDTQCRSTEDSAQQMHLLVILRQEFGISRHVASNLFRT
jgi:hypothetical protein